MQFANIVVTNTGGRTCTVNGLLGVNLYAGTQSLSTAVGDGTQLTPITLAPKAVASAGLTDYSTCSAGLSDSVHITLPGDATPISRPIALRGCKVEIKPLTLS
jgi:hypothetical protein